MTRTLWMAVSLALLIPAAARISRAQEDGEAQYVSFGEKNRATLEFSSKRADRQKCSLFVSNAVLDSGEEAFVLPVAHLHWRIIGRPALSETGWLYITPSRLVFSVQIGDKAHGFDLPRTDFKEKPATAKDFGYYPALQLNLREKLPASDSREQKFVFFRFGTDRCALEDSPYKKFLERAVNDFDGALAAFRQTAAALKQAGRIRPAPPPVIPDGGLSTTAP